MDLVDRADVEVYVISSLSGGTGSGSFLDVGFMARHLMRGSVSKIYGFFLLPRVFGGLPATGRRNANAYAALKELDYYMGLDYQPAAPCFLLRPAGSEPPHWRPMTSSTSWMPRTKTGSPSSDRAGKKGLRTCANWWPWASA